MKPESTVLHGEIETPRPLRAAGGKVSLRGWCVVAGVSTAPAVRLVTGAGMLAMTSRQARADVQNLLPGEPAAAMAGFTITGSLPPGLHAARFEAELPDGSWRVFKQLTLAVEAPPFLAALDEPVREGTLRDRVKVGGWALDPRAPVQELHLRYGHREIACMLGRPRADVAAGFPDNTHAASAGFESEDFLVAGHGPVRIRARLAGDRIAVVPTPVTFSIATDENHGPELDLAGERLALDRGSSPASAALPAAARPLNVVFVLPGSFAANSALHVAALANELSRAGHRCIVAVARDVETLSHHDRPRFRGVTHEAAMRGLVFPDGRGPDLIHAWTSRENVRAVTHQLRARHAARVLVHLEDNELQILALALNRSPDELARLPAAELDRLVPPDLSHPQRSREFLAAADGVTVITGRLAEFVPPGRPVQLITPSADARHYFPRPKPEAFRRLLSDHGQRTILVYHGNVHAANAAEMRELYLAVRDLNATGTPTLLIRAGLDAVDFLGPLAPEVAPHVLALGQVLHHGHLATLLALADVFVQPGRPDPFNDYRFPSKLPEFFAIGRPVVLPRANLGADLRHRTDAYVLDVADAAGIAAAVRELRVEAALYDRLARGAQAYAAAHFSWARSAEALAKFYQSLAGF